MACSSTPSRGTLMYVCIPVDHPIPGIDTCEESLGAVSDDIEIRGPILVIDDNPLNTKIIERQLQIYFRRRNIDAEIIEAHSGSEGLQMYKERLPSVVFVGECH